MSPNILALGTGSADSTKYYQTSFLVQDSDTNLLIDTGGGSGILTQLDRFGVPLSDIQNIFISHKHIDHIFGLFWILRFRGAAIHRNKAPHLTIYASRENIALLQQVSKMFLKEKVIALFDSKIIFIAVEDNNTITIHDWSIQFFNIHAQKEEQWGCNITLPTDTTISFIGDEPYTDVLLPYCKETDYLFHEAFCLEKDRETFNPQEISHSTAKEAASNAEQVKAKNVILFHTEDKATFGKRKELYTQEATESYSGNVRVPDDGDIITID